MDDEIREFLKGLAGLYGGDDGPTGTDFVPSRLWWAIKTARWFLKQEKYSE